MDTTIQGVAGTKGYRLAVRARQAMAWVHRFSPAALGKGGKFDAG